MKEETRLNKIIGNIQAIITAEQLTPSQYRYVTKRVRENLKLHTINTPSKLPDYLNSAEIHELLRQAYSRDTMSGLLCKFLILTGLRINEARQLLVTDLDIQNNQLKVRQGKGGKDRAVPLSIPLAQELQQYLKGRKTGYVFCKQNETAYSKRALQWMVEQSIKQCKFAKHITTHSLRHTFACMLLSKGMSLEQIQLMMGHSSRVTTEVYAKLELGSVKDQYLQLTASL